MLREAIQKSSTIHSFIQQIKSGDFLNKPVLFLLQSEAQTIEHCCFPFLFLCNLFYVLDKTIRKCYLHFEECFAQGRLDFGPNLLSSDRLFYEMRYLV